MIASPPTISQRHRIWQSIFVVSFLVALVYLPALQNRFVNWDDGVHLLQNPFIQPFDGSLLQRIFTTTVNHVYIPLTTLTFAIEHYFFGNNPFVYHLNNVLLQIFVTILIIPLALQLGLTLREGMLAAVIFGLHPMHAESVAWVTERKDVLYAFLYLLGVLTYLHYVSLIRQTILQGQGVVRFTLRKYTLFTLVILFGILSALAKPMALSFPFILGLCDFYYRRPIKPFVILEKIVIAAWLIPVGWITFLGYAHVPQISIGKAILLWSWSFSFHLYKFFIMDYFVLIYKVPQPISFINPVYALSVTAVLAIGIVCIFNRNNRLFIFAVFYYLCSVFLVLRWDQLKDLNMVADRFMYLPSLGICLWLGSIFVKVISSPTELSQRKKSVVIIIGVTFLALLILKTHQQILVWRDSVSLWRHQLVYQPQAATALSYNKLAQAYAQEMNLIEKLQKKGKRSLAISEQRQFDGIIRLYEASLAIKPDYVDSFFQLARINRATGDLTQSEQLLRKVIKYDPRHFDAYLELGQIYLEQGQRSSSIEQFKKAIAINPDNQDVVRRVNGFLM